MKSDEVLFAALYYSILSIIKKLYHLRFTGQYESSALCDI